MKSQVKKILIVDDDLEFRSTIAEILESEGFLTIEASDGVSAIGAFLLDHPDAIILDHKMPNLNGLDTLMHLKKLSPNVPVIMITAIQDSDFASQALLSGAYDIVFKPPQFDELILKVKEMMEDASS